MDESKTNAVSGPKSVWWRELTTEQLREYPHVSCGLSETHDGHGWRGVRKEFGGAVEVTRTLWCQGAPGE